MARELSPVAGGLVIALLLGLAVARGSLPLVLSVIALSSVVFVAMRPRVGLYLAFPLLMIPPNGALRSNLPLFHSPIQIIAMTTLGVALARRVLSRRPLPPSRIYPPLLVTLAVLGSFAIAGHGEVAGARFFRLLQGMWPLAMILLLVDTPRQARNVLLALTGTTVVLSLLWLPGLLHLTAATTDTVRTAATSGSPTLTVSLLGRVGSLSYQDLVAMGIVAPVLLALALAGSSRFRLCAAVGFAALSVAILLATYASAVACLAVGVVAVSLLVIIAPRSREASATRNLGGLPVACALLLGGSSPPAQRAIQRLVHPSLDLSGNARSVALSQGWHAFLSKPVLGSGAYDRLVITRAGWALEGHNSLVVMAYEFGLVLLIPFLWLLGTLGREYVGLLRQSRDAQSRALAIGLLASLLTAVATSFLTPVFGQVVQDTAVWTLAGLAIVLRSWSAADVSGARP